MNDNSLKVIEVEINDVLPNRFQPRLKFEEDEILELSDSIKEHGVIQPLIVRQVGNKYEIIAGERRYRASVLAGRETVPVIVRNLNDKESAELAIIENVQRKNLSPIEEAISYKKILDMGYLTQTTLALKLGKSQSAVANKIRLLNLSDEVQEALFENKISERHARSLLKLSSIKQQNDMLNRIINERLTVRDTDEEIQKLIGNNENIKIEDERGEDMENNSFDIFGVSNQNVTPTIVPPQTEIPQPTPVQQPQMEILQSTPEPAIVAPQMEVLQSTPEPAIVAPQMEVLQSTPEPAIVAQQPTVEMPQMEAIVQQPATEMLQAEVVPPQPTVEESISFDQPPIDFEVPVTAPIEESTPLTTTPDLSAAINNDISVPLQNQPETNTIPEPIIITDYNKQYDPIMPDLSTPVVKKADFKEVINILRECSNKIEQLGYSLELEEYNLENIYQVMFNINKN